MKIKLENSEIIKAVQEYVEHTYGFTLDRQGPPYYFLKADGARGSVIDYFELEVKPPPPGSAPERPTSWDKLNEDGS